MIWGLPIFSLLFVLTLSGAMRLVHYVVSRFKTGVAFVATFVIIVATIAIELWLSFLFNIGEA